MPYWKRMTVQTFGLGFTPGPTTGLSLSVFAGPAGIAVGFVDLFRRFFWRSSYNPECTAIANAFWDWVKRLTDEIRRTSPYEITDEQYWDVYFRSCAQFQEALRRVPHCGEKSAEERPCRGWWGVSPKRQPWAFPGSEEEVRRALEERRQREWPLPRTRPRFAEQDCEPQIGGGYLCTKPIEGAACEARGARWFCIEPTPPPVSQMNLTPFLLAGGALLLLALILKN